MTFPLSVTVFRAQYPEFAQTPEELVQAKLDDAETQIDETVWGDKAAHGHGLLAADLLAAAGYSREAAGERRTNYGARFDRIASIVGGAYRLVLD